MSGTETERNEYTQCFDCLENRSEKEYRCVGIVTEWCNDCRDVTTHMILPEAPKGKKAVTLYIPDGMSLGYAMMRAFWNKHPEAKDKFQQWTFWQTDQQIQKAIDKAFNQEKDEL